MGRFSLQATKQSSNTGTTTVTATKDLQWNAVHDRLVHYEKEFGHSDVLTSYNDGGIPHLGKWVSRQRGHKLEHGKELYNVIAGHHVSTDFESSMRSKNMQM